MGYRTLTLDTDRSALFDITPLVREAVMESGVVDGLAVVWVPHTTAAVSIVSFPDPRGLEDVMDEIRRLIPTRIDFKHEHDTPQDAAGHVKSALVGASLTLIVADGEMLLGHSQKIFLFEFDGPRQRKIHVKAISG
jgi:secondary thiamine-phosphate synthase enzyme